MQTMAIKKLNIQEKLQMMESLWDSLCTAPAVDSPVWHGDILADREQAILDRRDEFEDWESAKATLRSQEP